jgi:hypothetical protein
MAPEPPDTEPEIIRAGETIAWTRSLPDYPATEYTLRYYLNGPAAYTLTATAYNTTDHLISEAAASTSAWVFGIYSYEAYAEKGAGATLERYFISSGFFTVKTAAGKSFAKTMVDAIEAILSGRATNKDLDVVAKNLGASSISRDPAELMKYRDKFMDEYRAEVEAENMAQGKGSGRLIRYRFQKA